MESLAHYEITANAIEVIISIGVLIIVLWLAWKYFAKEYRRLVEQH